MKENKNSIATATNSTISYLTLTLAFFFFFFSSLFSTSHGVTADVTQINIPHTQTHQNCSLSDNFLECEIQQMKFKVARLEILAEMTGQELYTKSLHIAECEKKIDDLSHTILRLESVLSNFKDTPDVEMIKVFEEQVRELEADVRRNDLDIQRFKIRVKDDENSVKFLASKIETMAKIVPELWFHVQKLEQAREVIERRTVELKRRSRNEKCPFFKFINKFPGRHYQNMVVHYASEALNQLRISYSAVKKYHHQLQGLVKREMERNEFTAVFAGEELVFFLVSVVAVFPFILALQCLLSVFFLAFSVVVFLFSVALRLLFSVPFLASVVLVFSLILALR